MNSKLITNSVALLSKNASTVTSFWVSILSSSIFTITSLNMSPLSRLQQDSFFMKALQTYCSQNLIKNYQIPSPFKLLFTLFELFPYSNIFLYLLIPQFLQFQAKYSNLPQLQQFLPQSTFIVYKLHLGTYPAY